MPIYTYMCRNCGHSFEKVLKMDNRKEPEEEACEKCNEFKVRQIINSNFELMAPDQLGRVKPHGDWRNHLDRIKRNNPGSDFTTW